MLRRRIRVGVKEDLITWWPKIQKTVDTCFNLPKILDIPLSSHQRLKGKSQPRYSS